MAAKSRKKVTTRTIHSTSLKQAKMKARRGG
jgi:hypothetical protein